MWNEYIFFTVKGKLPKNAQATVFDADNSIDPVSVWEYVEAAVKIVVPAADTVEVLD